VAKEKKLKESRGTLQKKDFGFLRFLLILVVVLLLVTIVRRSISGVGEKKSN